MITYAFPPMGEVGAFRPFRFWKYLSLYGYTPQVVTAAAQPPSSQNPGIRYAPDKISYPTGAVTSFLNTLYKAFIHFCFPRDHRFPWIPSALAEAGKCLSNAPVRILFSTSPPISGQIVGLLLKQRHKTIWVADFRDPFVGNVGTRSRRVAFVERRLERWIFARADVLIANTDALAKAWSLRYPQWRHKIVTLWNGFDPAEPIQATPIPPRDRRHLSHIGHIYRRNLGPLLAALDRLIKAGAPQVADLHLHLVGDLEMDCVPDISLLRSLTNRGYVRQTPTIPVAGAHAVMQQSDYLLLLDFDYTEDSAAVTVPYKLYLYVRVGRPILAFIIRNSPSERILALSGVPYVAVYKDDPDKVVDAKLLQFFSLPTDPVTPSDWFLENFDGVKQTQTLAGIFDKLLSAG
jgi:glycosyltransferase involved in cell wall biosynthesis